MDSTGSTPSQKIDPEKPKNKFGLPKDKFNYKYLPSIAELGLNEKGAKKRLDSLLESYMRPE